MDIAEKLRILAEAAKYDASCASSGGSRKRPDGGMGNAEGMGICHSYTPDGRCISLLKILLTNYCLYDCSYCVNRVSSATPRARFTVDEVVQLTMDFYRRNYIEGLFLSSGVIKSPDETMAQLAAIARQLRQDYKFGGYIHLKAVPGASTAAIAESGRWADRLSANIEMATQEDLTRLAPAKTHAETEDTMSQIRDAIQISKQASRDDKSLPRFARAGQSTQMIVGATPTSDAVILQKAGQLYEDYRLRRVYYSAFSPIPDNDPLLPPIKTPLVREHRLYQADWLIRFYGYQPEELTAAGTPNLSLDQDPKLSWALRHREFFPVDINTASKMDLLRIPGIGVRNVQRIMDIRRYHKLTLTDLKKLKISIRKTQHFVITAERDPAPLAIDRLDLPKRFKQPEQLMLLDAAVTSQNGEL